jgi:four helix bundle protein
MSTISLDFLVFANRVIEGLPRGRSHLADPFTRASMSVVLNIAEGAGKVSKGDKRRNSLTARGSATESAALLDASSRSALRRAAPVSVGGTYTHPPGRRAEPRTAATIDRPSRPRRSVRGCDRSARSPLDHGSSRSCRRTFHLMKHAAAPMERTCSKHSNFRSDPIGHGRGHGKTEPVQGHTASG